jgi:hypothetical protein
MQMADGSVGWCTKLVCMEVRPITMRAATTEIPDQAEELHFGFGTQAPNDRSIRIPVDAPIALLEQLGATVTFDEAKRQQAGQRALAASTPS